MTDSNPIKAADLAKLWKLSPGRISQLVRDGMPLDSVEAAREWRRRRLEDCEKSPEVPHYLLKYQERFTLEQEIYDRLVYQHRVSGTIASQICWAVFCRRSDGLLSAGSERPFMFNGQIYQEPTWFALIMAHDPEDHGVPPNEAGGLNEDFLAAARQADLAALAQEPGFLPEKGK